MLCSHGKTTDANVLQSNLDYLKKIEQQGRAFLITAHAGLNLKELEYPSTLINYPFEKAIADIIGSRNGLDSIPDPEFYGEAHENNTRAVLEWLASMT